MQHMKAVIIAAAVVGILGIAWFYSAPYFALKELKTQAANGDEIAQFNLGVLYAKGQGVPQDYAKARELFEKAAAQGNADGQVRLGMLYAYGGGVPQDYAKAHMWLSLAATQGNKDVAKERDKVAMKMTPAQLVEAQRLVQQCQARQYKGC